MLCLHGLAVNHFKITFLFEMTSFLLGWLNYPVLYCSDETKDTKISRVLAQIKYVYEFVSRSVGGFIGRFTCKFVETYG